MPETQGVSKREEQEQRRVFKKRMRATIVGIVIAMLIGGIAWWAATADQNSSNGTEDENQILSRYGLHWHSTLSITIKGEKMPIPANIGLAGAVHNPIHTHDPDGVIHLEFSGRVTEKDTTLKKFFEAWGKDFSKDSLLGNRNGEGGTIKMFVNGTENAEYENYHMKDGDKIELSFE